MKKRTIGPGQLAGLVFLSLFTLGTETLPSSLSAVGSAAWLCPLAAGGVVCLVSGLAVRVPLTGRTLLSGPEHSVRNRGLCGLLLLWGLLMTAVQTDRIGRRLAGDLRGSAVLLSAAVLLLAAWMASGGLAALGRAGQIFTMAIGLSFLIILLFGLPGLRWDWVLLWTGAEMRSIPLGLLEALGELAVGLYALLFLEDLEPKGERRRGPGKLAALFPMLSLGSLLVLGRLGPGLAGEVERPFLQMVSGLGFQGAFQRLEELVSALWLPGDLTLLALLLLCQRRLLAGLLGRGETQAMIWLPALGTLGLVLLRLPESRWWASGATWLGGLAAGVLLTLLMVRTKKSEKNRKGG